MPNEEELSVVIPLYFEEEVVYECYSRLSRVMNENHLDYELIFVNDGSTDNTLNILKELALNDKKVKIIDFSRNFGQQVAVTAGIFYACGRAVVVIDADLQDPPELIIDMVKKWEEGYEVVYAKRKKRNGETWLKILTAKYFYRTLNYLSDIDIPKDAGDFRLIDRRVVDVFNSMPERNRFVRGIISWAGFRQTYIEYEREQRYAGKTKYPLKKMLRFAADGIISFSAKPLKSMICLGSIIICLTFFILVYSLTTKLLGGYITPGWTSIMVSLAFFSGIQLMSIGVLGEYIARIYDESKGRPLYVIREKINFVEVSHETNR